MIKILSIIVPSYNMEAYLPKCLGSLIIDDKELLDKLEVIVVNDGSKDRTSEIAHDFERRYPGIFRVIDKENGHYGSCVNAALPIARGTFVKMLDADDSYDTEGLEKLLAHIWQICDNPEIGVDVVFTDTICVNGNGCETKSFKLGFTKSKEFGLEELTYEQIKNLWMNQVAYRTVLFEKIKYVQTTGVPFTDQEWMFAPMSLVRRASFLPITVYRYLIGREGQTIDEKYYLKNFSVIRGLTLKHIDEYLKCYPSATAGGKHYLDERLFSRIALVCFRHLVFSKDALAKDEPEFVRFCETIQRGVPNVYKRLEGMRLFRRIPIGLVDAWRRKQRGYPLPYWFLFYACLPLSKIKMRVSRKLQF